MHAPTCSLCGAALTQGDTHCPACRASLAASVHFHVLPPGTAIRAGAYIIGEVLGEGGFGITYQGIHKLLKRDIAIKELFPEEARRVGTVVSMPPQKQQQFKDLQATILQEAQHIADLHCDHIVEVYDVFHENGTVYIVMEYLRGQTLEGRVADVGPISLAQASQIALDICAALEAVHDSSLLHRDIKPANIMLTEAGKAVLIDFGSAREFLVDQTVRHTQILTPDYAAPEQYSTQARFGPYTDIFSLGAALYFALTGAPPVRVVDRLQNPDLRCIVFPSGIEGNLVAAIQQALAIDIADRPQTVTAFRHLIAPPAEDASIAKRNVRPAGKADRKRRRRQLVWGMTLLLALVVGGLAIMGITGWRNAQLVAPNQFGQNRLHEAASQGRADDVRELLAKVDPGLRANNGFAPLHEAAHHGHTHVVEILLQSSANREARANNGFTPLHAAVDQNHTDTVQVLLDAGADPEVQAHNGFTPLHLSASQGYTNMAQALLNRGVNPETPAKDGQTALHLAASQGHADVVQTLLAMDADPEAQAYNRRTPLHLSAISGHTNVIQALLDKGADPEMPGIDGQTALHLAVSQGHADAARALLDGGGDLEARANDLWTPLMHAIAAVGRAGIDIDNIQTVLVLLLDRGANLYARGNDQTPWGLALERRAQGHPEAVNILVRYQTLREAIAHGDVTAIQAFLDEDADLNILSDDGQTPLHVAVGQDHATAVQLLLDKGADPEIPTGDGQTALHLAVRLGYADVVRALLDGGADPEALTAEGQTALHLAVDLDRANVVEALLGKGVDPETPIVNGQTALHLAVRLGYADVVRSLLDGGADPEALTAEGQTALHLAVDLDHANMVEVLLDKGANVEALNGEGQTALHLAIRLDHADVVGILLDKGVNPETAITDSQSPLFVAVRLDHASVVEVLLDKGADPEALTAEGQTALHLAASLGHADAIKALLEGGADLEAQQGYGDWTPLHVAVSAGHAEVVQMLLAQGADLEARDRQGRTPLMNAILAITRNDTEWENLPFVLEILLDRGADQYAIARSVTPWQLLDDLGERGYPAANQIREQMQAHTLTAICRQQRNRALHYSLRQLDDQFGTEEQGIKFAKHNDPTPRMHDVLDAVTVDDNGVCVFGFASRFRYDIPWRRDKHAAFLLMASYNPALAKMTSGLLQEKCECRKTEAVCQHFAVDCMAYMFDENKMRFQDLQ